MTMTIHIKPELASRLRDEAERDGLDADTYVARALEERLGNAPPALSGAATQSLTTAEAALLTGINEGLPDDLWGRYHALLARRRAQTLTVEEQTALIGLSDQIEAMSARRAELLARLARLRNTTLPALMTELGLKPLPYV